VFDFFCITRNQHFVADFHLGKAASFRKAGIPLPSGSTTENVERLDRAIARTRAKSVVFLGDFLHSADGRQPRTFERFAAWRESRKSVDLTLVRGNHDKKAGDPPESHPSGRGAVRLWRTDPVRRQPADRSISR